MVLNGNSKLIQIEIWKHFKKFLKIFRRLEISKIIFPGFNKSRSLQIRAMFFHMIKTRFYIDFRRYWWFLIPTLRYPLLLWPEISGILHQETWFLRAKRRRRREIFVFFGLKTGFQAFINNLGDFELPKLINGFYWTLEIYCTFPPAPPACPAVLGWGT